MKHSNYFPVPIRKQLAKQLGHDGSFRMKAKVSYDQKFNDVKQRVLNGYAEQKLGSEVVSSILATFREYQLAEERLGSIGIKLTSYGDLDWRYDCPFEVRRMWLRSIEEQIGSMEDVDRLLGERRMEILTIESLSEAQKIIEELDSTFSR